MTSDIEVVVTLDTSNEDRKIGKVTIKPRITERNYDLLLKKNAKVIIKILPYAKEDKETVSGHPLPPIKELKFRLDDLQKSLFKNQNVNTIQINNRLQQLAKISATYSEWKEEKLRRELQTSL